MRLLSTLLLMMVVAQSYSQLRLPSFLTNHLVLQRNEVNRIWGWASPRELVQVEFRNKTYPALADNQGRWEVFLEAAPAGPATNLTIRTAHESLALEDIQVGEVWVCSGQSNMEWPMALLKETYATELATADNPQIRFITLEKAYHNLPQTDAAVSSAWKPVTPATLPECSAVAYFFAKKLQATLQIPIGLVISSWGGTPAEAWTSFEGLGPFPNYTTPFLHKLFPLDLDQLAEQQKQNRRSYEKSLQEQAPLLQRALNPAFQDESWEQVELPNSWEATGYAQVDGVVLYRIKFEIKSGDAHKSATLYLPAIDDMDSTYLNGVYVGSLAQWNEPRVYSIPAGLLQPGTNVLVIRVQDNGGGGGMTPSPAQYKVVVGKKTYPLAGPATFKLLAAQTPITSNGLAMQNQPSLLYNAMIAPLLPLAIQGVIWYQGESNADRPGEYATLFPAMIQDWRNRWGQGDFPFLFVQLSSYGLVKNEPTESNWALLREAQANTRSLLPHTGMAVTTDVGNPSDIHPKQKQEVGDRLAAVALNQVYGQENTISNGPVLKKYAVEGATVILDFDHTEGGLTLKGSSAAHFAVAGADRKFYWAEARLEGNRLILSTPSVSKPIAVRYAWADSPVSANLYNGAGFPAEPFRTDNW